MSEVAYVFVRRQPSDYQIAKYKLDDFEEPHWSRVSGGVKTSMFNMPFIYGYVSCLGSVDGSEVAHSGRFGLENHGPCPHRIKVCALKMDNSKEVYGALLKIVGPKP